MSRCSLPQRRRSLLYPRKVDCRSQRDSSDSYVDSLAAKALELCEAGVEQNVYSHAFYPTSLQLQQGSNKNACVEKEQRAG